MNIPDPMTITAMMASLVLLTMVYSCEHGVARLGEDEAVAPP
jgi:hypothetical protein